MFCTHSLPSLNSPPLSLRKGWSPFQDLCSQSELRLLWLKISKIPRAVLCSASCSRNSPLFYLSLTLLLLLLSHFSHVRLCATPETAAHQASLSLGFSRQEHWSGLPFPSPMHESEKWKWSCSVMSDSSDLMDCSPPGSSVHRIFQAKVLEWGAIAFSSQWIFHSYIFLLSFWAALVCTSGITALGGGGGSVTKLCLTLWAHGQ